MNAIVSQQVNSRSLGEQPPSRLRIARHRGLITAAAAFSVLLAIIMVSSATPLGYYDLSQMTASGATLAITAMGQTLVILSGGFDLSAAAVVSLVNVTLASLPAGSVTSPYLLILIGVAIGAAVGAFNGFIIAYVRLQPIVVTLATMFILQGITLLVMDKPGGLIDPSLYELLAGDLIPNLIPAPLAMLAILLGFWFWLKRTSYGVALYSVGGDEDSARSAGIRTARIKFLTYIIAGGFYGLGGVFISAQTGAGDPLVGNPMLLQIFAAVVVGGTLLGGGRGGLLGTVIGAYVLMLMVNILLIMNVSAYYSTVAESAILLLAVLAATLHGKSVLAQNIRKLRTQFAAYRSGDLPRQKTLISKRLVMPGSVNIALPKVSFAEMLTRNKAAIKLAAPAYICFFLVIVATQLVLGNAMLNFNYYNTLLVLASFLALLALGQGTVILTGGLDLSMPWTIALCGIVLSGLVRGSDEALLYAVPLVLVLGCVIGFINGFGIVSLGLSPIVMTLAMNGILQGAALLYSGGTPDGFAAPLLRHFMTYRGFGVTPVVLMLIVFVAGAILLLGRTPFGRKVYAIGNSQRAAQLSGINVGATTIKVYMLSGFCAALVGILLSGLSGQASLGMGDDYLLPSIAAVVVGGGLITGGRGSYAGMLGGVLFLTALATFLAGTTFPNSMRSIVYGLVVLGAVIALREKR